MDSPSTDPPADRIDRLEQELARISGLLEGARSEVGQLRWAVVVLVLGFVGAIAGVALIRSGVIESKVLLGGALPKKVESKEFALINREGKRVMFADYDKWGYPSLVFLDLDGNYKMGVLVHPQDKGSPGLVFYDRTGTRAEFRMEEGGGAAIRLLGREKKGGIALSVAADGTPSLKMTDRSGKTLFEAPAPADARPAEVGSSPG